MGVSFNRWAVLPFLGLSLAQAAEPGAFFQGNAAEIRTQCEATRTAALARAGKLAALPLAGLDSSKVMREWNLLASDIQGMSGPAELLAAVSTQADVRDAADACSLLLSGLWGELYQRRDLFDRMQAVKPADAIDATARKSVLDNFEAYGVSLPEAQRVHFKALQDELDALSTRFNKNLASYKADPASVTFTAAELAGADMKVLAPFRQADGRYLLNLSYPVRDTVLGYATNPETRRRFYIAFQNRGGQANIDILQQMSDKRREQAALLGYASYAQWQLKTKMAGSPARVEAFLGRVGEAVGSLEKKELAELAAFKLKEGGKGPLNRWDLTFYQNRLKKARYALDQNEVRRQFPTEGSVKWVLEVSSRLYGVTFRENTTLPRWHPEVRAYDVVDNKSGQYVGSFYLDLYPRDDKYSHAAAFGVRTVSQRAGVKPVSVLVTNFDRNGFDSEELETMFHEFGHVLHGVLSTARDSYLGGTSVKQDFVEAPSQMYEEWARRPESLKVFTEACPSCRPVDMKLVDKMRRARSFGKGIQYARQLLYARFDLSLVGPRPAGVLASWQKLEGATPLGTVPGTLFPAGFGHLAGGYAAGYYGYMWSEVLALDMLSGFGKNVMDPAAGQRYRKLVLSRGGEEDPTKMVTEFLGRAPNEKAFFDEITGRRQ